METELQFCSNTCLQRTWTDLGIDTSKLRTVENSGHLRANQFNGSEKSYLGIESWFQDIASTPELKLQRCKYVLEYANITQEVVVAM